MTSPRQVDIEIEENAMNSKVKFLSNSGEDSLGRVDVCALGFLNVFLEVLPLLLPNYREEILETLENLNER